MEKQELSQQQRQQAQANLARLVEAKRRGGQQAFQEEWRKIFHPNETNPSETSSKPTPSEAEPQMRSLQSPGMRVIHVLKLGDLRREC